MASRSARRVFLAGLLTVSFGFVASDASAAGKRTSCGEVGEEYGVLSYGIYAYAPTKCAKAESIILDYLRLGEGKAMTRDGYRCTTRKGGTVADGTFAQVSCKAKGKLAMRAYYLGA